jgi:hypothetical protein
MDSLGIYSTRHEPCLVVSELMKRQDTQQHANMKPGGWWRYPTGRHRSANERWRSKPRPTRCSLKQYCSATSHRYQRWQRRSSATHHLPRSFPVPRFPDLRRTQAPGLPSYHRTCSEWE